MMFWSIWLLLAWSSGIALAVPESFGKTHFIVGQPIHFEQKAQYLATTKSAPNKNISVRSYFSSDNDVKQKLIKLIDQEQKTIRAAVFIITDPDIARTLAHAKKRGVHVELVTDVSCLKERASKMGMLCNNGCAIYVYNPPEQQKGSSLMHHKFALFESPSIVWTGSYNFTKAASKANQENVVTISDQKTFKNFVAEFERLKKRSYRYSKPIRS